MKIVVTGSAGHLGGALVRGLRADGHSVLGTDRLPSEETEVVGSITDVKTVDACLRGADAVVHAATLHKPHVATHPRQAFVDVNVTGTLTLLEAAVRHGVTRFVFTSTTSTFGRALRPRAGAPAAWIDETIRPVPKNIYGVTKTAAEDLCEISWRGHGLPSVVLRTSRFFPEADDDPDKRAAFDSDNLKANEFLHRRVAVADVVAAHALALQRAPELGFDRFIVSATTPFSRADAADLALDAAAIVRARVPDAAEAYARRGWTLPRTLDRVYDNERARRTLAWQPRVDFAHVVQRLKGGHDVLG